MSNNNSKTKINFGGYGWIMIIFALLMYFFMAGWTADGLNVFTGGFAAAKGWDSATLLSLATPASLVGVIGSFFFGWLAQKKGPKFVIVIGLILAGIATIWFGNTTSILQWGIAFSIMCLFGNGYGFIAPGTLITNWFPTKKGIALGWATMGMPLATAVFVPAISFLFNSMGISKACIIGGLVLIILGIIAIFLVKDTPEEIGRYPDNEKISKEQLAANLDKIDNYVSPFTVGKLLKDRDMWLTSLGFGCCWLVTVGIVTQLVPRLMTLGFSNATAIALLSAAAICAVPGSIVWGWVDQKFGTRIAGMCYAGVYIITLLLLIFQTKNIVITFITIVFVGAGLGGIKNLLTSMVGTVYGRYDFTAANKLITPIAIAVRTFAFLVMSIGLSLTGSYSGSYAIFIGFDIIGMILIFFITKTPKGKME